MAYKKGRRVAISATARKLAVITYIMLTRKENYQPQGVEDYRENVRVKKVKSIQRTMKQYGIDPDEINPAA